MGKLIYGVALNDSGYPTVKYWRGVSGQKRVVWKCPFFSSWKKMIERCYSKGYSERPAYKDCFVCDEWLTFSCFKQWMEMQDWKGKNLDKDLIKIGNKQYSPELSRFVSQSVNNLIVVNVTDRDLPIGVQHGDRGKPYRAMASNPEIGKVVNLGSFDCAVKAHFRWVEAKSGYAKQLCSLESDDLVISSLLSYFDRVSRYHYPDFYLNQLYPDKE